MKYKRTDTHLDIIQVQQDEEYSFPYHHIVRRSGAGFTQCFNDSWGMNYLATVEYMLEQIGQERFYSVIDVGCGDGRLTKEILQRFPNRRIVGIDYSSRAIALARAMDSDIDFRCIDITKQRIDEKFDLAVLMEVYEHIQPDISDNFCSSLASLINPGGILCLTVPHINKAVEYKHYRHFTLDMIAEELKPYFELVEFVYIEKKAYSKRIIDSIMTNRMFILNNKRIANWLYSYYKNNLFFAEDESSCQRIFARAKRLSY